MVIRFRELKDAKVLLNLALFQAIISLCNYCLASICDLSRELLMAVLLWQLIKR